MSILGGYFSQPYPFYFYLGPLCKYNELTLWKPNLSPQGFDTVGWVTGKASCR